MRTLAAERWRRVRLFVRPWLLGVSVPLVLVLVGSAPAALDRSVGRSVEGPPEALGVRSIWTGEFGVSHPAGLTYLPDERSLVVAERQGNRTRLARVGVLEELLGTLSLPAVSSPATLVADGASGGLSVVDGGELVSVAKEDRGKGEPPVSRSDVSALGLGDPEGATVDGAGDLLVLDNGGRAIVRVRGGGGRERISVAGVGAGRLQGLAFNPVDGLLYVASPKENLLYGLDGSGGVRKQYRLDGLELQDLQAFVFAPSADPTDDPAAQHLYVADAGGPKTLGRVVEATLTPTAVSATAEIVTGTHVQTIQTSLYSPPSPDPSGIVYVAATDRFIISDSEVDEMSIYQGINLYDGTRTGSGTGVGTTVPWSHEPAGLGYNPADRTLFVSDDDADRVYIDRPGADGRYGTADDSVTNFSTTAFGSTDPEDVAYDTATGHLFISDGIGIEVYEVDPVNGVFGDGNDVVTHFDVAQYGARDAEGIGIDPQRGLLLVVDPSTKSIYEVTKSGALSRTIDCRGIPTTNRAYADVTMAPTSNPSDPPSTLDYWMVDRQVDNGADPNENDGKLYEVTAPTADAPPSVTVTAPAEGATVSGTTLVQASASDDVGVTQVAFSVDGTSIGTDTNGADGWSVQWNSSSVADGPHTVAATATDTAGQTASDSNAVTVDNVDSAPTVTVTNPAEGATVSGTVVVQASASDDVGVTQVAFAVDGISIGTDTNGADGWSAQWNTSSGADGPHTVAATATDTGGQTASDSNAVTVANDTPPTVTLTAPAEGATVSGIVLAQATASDNVGVTQVVFFVDGVPIGTDTDGADGWSASWNTLTAMDGAHTVTATATDTSGLTATDSNAVVVDNVDSPPSVVVTTPVEGATVSGTVNVGATASDDVGVTQVSFSVDGAPIGTDTNGADGWSVSWNTTGVADGARTVAATATDTAGQTGNDSNGVTVDNTPPAVAVTAPSAGATVSGSVVVAASASDATAVASVRFFVDGTSIGTDTNGADGWSVSWDTTGVADGNRSLTAVATDSPGNAATSAAVSVTVDNPDFTTLEVPVRVGVDDADEVQDGTVRRSNGDLELGTDTGIPTTVGLRFTGVTVPQGATITRAYVQFQVDEKGTTATSLTIRAESSDNSAGFTSTAFNLSSRPRTTASAGWTPPQWLTVGQAGPDQRTPDLSAAVAEVIGRPGWVAGNALTILVTGSGRRTAESFEGGFPPKLHLEYTSQPVAPPANTSPPTISGIARLAQTLTADPGTWSGGMPLTYAYQWRRCDAAGEACADIGGAAGQSYLVADADVGSTIRVNVTASNSAGSATATAVQTAIVEGLPVDGLSQVADSVTGSSDPTYYATNHRVAVTAGGRQFVIYGRHATGVQLMWRDPGRTWRQETQGQVSDGVLLGGTGTGDWSASIAIARDALGEEHAWVVWGAAATGGTSKALQMRRLSSLDAPGGPVVGPIVTLDAAASGPARPDLAFERAPDGSFRGCVVWTRLFSASKYELVAAWFTDLSTDTPALHDSASLITNVSAPRNPTLTPSAGGLRVVARSSSDRLQLFAHDSATPLASWSASLGGISTKSGSMPSAVGLASGAILAAVESDTTAHVVTVQRFASGGAVSTELQLSGYSMPTIATDGNNAWLVMIRLSDGYVVSRSFSPALGWSPDDRVEVGAEGGGGYSWPNLLREADGRLRFIVRGPSGATKRAAVLSFQRLL